MVLNTLFYQNLITLLGSRLEHHTDASTYQGIQINILLPTLNYTYSTMTRH